MYKRQLTRTRSARVVPDSSAASTSGSNREDEKEQDTVLKTDITSGDGICVQLWKVLKSDTPRGKAYRAFIVVVALVLATLLCTVMWGSFGWQARDSRSKLSEESFVVCTAYRGYQNCYRKDRNDKDKGRSDKGRSETPSNQYLEDLQGEAFQNLLAEETVNRTEILETKIAICLPCRLVAIDLEKYSGTLDCTMNLVNGSNKDFPEIVPRHMPEIRDNGTLVVEVGDNEVASYAAGDFLPASKEWRISLGGLRDGMGSNKGHKDSENLDQGGSYADVDLGWSFGLNMFINVSDKAVSPPPVVYFFLEVAYLPGWAISFEVNDMKSKYEALNSSKLWFFGRASLEDRLKTYVTALTIATWLVTAATSALCIMIPLLRRFGIKDWEDKDTALRLPLLAFAGAILFALPQIRGLFPLAPSTASTALDAKGIWAQLMAVAVSTTFLALDTIELLASTLVKNKGSDSKDSESSTSAKELASALVLVIETYRGSKDSSSAKEVAPLVAGENT